MPDFAEGARLGQDHSALSFLKAVVYLCLHNFQLLWKNPAELFTQLVSAHSLVVCRQSCPVPLSASGTFLSLEILERMGR